MQDPEHVSVITALRTHRHTTNGRIIYWGSLFQLPFLIYMFAKAWSRFPENGTDDFLMAGLLHLAAPLALVGIFIKYGEPLAFRRSAVHTWLLALVACVPLFVSLPLVG